MQALENQMNTRPFQAPFALCAPLGAVPVRPPLLGAVASLLMFLGGCGDTASETNSGAAPVQGAPAAVPSEAAAPGMPAAVDFGAAPEDVGAGGKPAENARPETSELEPAVAPAGVVPKGEDKEPPELNVTVPVVPAMELTPPVAELPLPAPPQDVASQDVAPAEEMAVGGAQSAGAASLPQAPGMNAGGAQNAGGATAEPPEEVPEAPVDSDNPLAALIPLGPADPELAKDFADYLEDLGEVELLTSGSGGARTLVNPILVPPNTAYDGQGEKLTADPTAMRCDTAGGEQAENQRPYFILGPGASVSNVTIAFPGCEGIHMMGDNELSNILWEDVGEDAASVRSYFPGGDILIKDSEGHSASDKMFQFNAPCDVRIENFTGSDMGKLVRQNGRESFPLNIDLNNIKVTGVISAVVQSDSPLCLVRYHNLSYEFTGSGDKSDRVFRDIPPGNVTEY